MVLTSKVIIAIGAHPDDIELGCGATICKATEKGQRVIAVYLTKGEKSGLPEVRMNESIKALSLLGVKEVYFENFVDTQIPDSFEVIDCIEKYVVKFKPDSVFIHSINDVHQDHRRIGWLALSACRNVSKILAYETPRVQPGAFKPSYFIDIEGFIAKKLAALECHETQKIKHYLSYEATVALSSFRGSQMGIKHAESFEIVKFLER
jgi:LmbE family N-acetylglucosaminyl deacetylase